MKKKNNFENIKRGTFTKQAKLAKMSVNRFTTKVLNNKDDFNLITQKRATLAKNFAKMRKKKKKKN